MRFLGAVAGSGLLWVVAEGYFRLRGREGMGLGDVKMMAAVGAFLGVKRTLMTVLAGSLLGSVIGILLIASFEKGARLRIAIWYISRSGRAAGGFFRNSRAPLVSVTAGGEVNRESRIPSGDGRTERRIALGTVRDVCLPFCSRAAFVAVVMARRYVSRRIASCRRFAAIRSREATIPRRS